MRRVAVWQGDQWVELTVEHLVEMEHTGGKSLSILATLEWATGGVVEGGLHLVDVEPPYHAPEPCVTVPVIPDEPPATLATNGPSPTAEEINPPTTPPNWGGKDPKDVDDEVADFVGEGGLRFFTFKLEDGSVLLNNGTTKGANALEAEAAIRQTWGMLAGSQPGKAIAECTLQDGRVGEDQPVPQLGPKPAHPEAEAAPPNPNHVEDGAGSLFRWHRGSLDESMATVVPCESMAELLAILQGVDADVTGERVDVKHYTYDERIEWDTYLVTVDGQAVGMTNGEL